MNENIVQSMERLVPAKAIKWREKRGDGWSETLYTGIAAEIDGVPVIISKLSHGLRVLPKKADSEYQFEGEGSATQISESFIKAAKSAFDADKEFQTKLPEYQKALTKN
jgi:hypothetical protein